MWYTSINLSKHLQELESHSIEALCKALFKIGLPNCLNQMIGLFALRTNLQESAKMIDPSSCFLRLVVVCQRNGFKVMETQNTCKWIRLMFSQAFPLTDRACACKVACACRLNVFAKVSEWSKVVPKLHTDYSVWLLLRASWQCSAQTAGIILHSRPQNYVICTYAVSVWNDCDQKFNCLSAFLLIRSPIWWFWRPIDNKELWWISPLESMTLI